MCVRNVYVPQVLFSSKDEVQGRQIHEKVEIRPRGNPWLDEAGLALEQYLWYRMS